MKKLLLLSALSAVAMGASAQLQPSSSLVKVDGLKPVQQTNTTMAAGNLNMQAAPIVAAPANGTKSTAKTTFSGGRWYNWSEYLGKLSVSIFSNTSLPYMWDKRDMLGIYSSTTSSTGFEADTIMLRSYADVIHPFYTAFNNRSAWGGDAMAVTATSAYTLDSIRVYGAYGRNSTKTGVVDTLRVTAVYGGAATGSDLPIYYFSDDATDHYWMDNWGYDTVRFAGLGYDSIANKAKGTTAVSVDYLLTEARRISDTVGGGGYNVFQVPVGLNVPAGNLVGVSVTFKSGEAYTPNDTVFFGSTATEAFKYGMFRPLFHEQNVDTFPTYYPGSYNSGYTKVLKSAGSFSPLYEPTLIFVGAYDMEFPYIDYKLSCATCTSIDGLSIGETPSLVDEVKAYPVPANGTLNVAFKAKESANVNVSITNMVGQTVMIQNLGTITAGQQAKAVFNTSALPAGIYMYTVDANGQRNTSRFSVAH